MNAMSWLERRGVESGGGAALWLAERRFLRLGSGGEKETELFGHLSFATLCGDALIVLGTSSRVYIHMSTVAYIHDEAALAAACTLAVGTVGGQEFRLTSTTSPDYQLWIQSLREMYEATHGEPPPPPSSSETGRSRHNSRNSIGGSEGGGLWRGRSSSSSLSKGLDDGANDGGVGSDKGVKIPRRRASSMSRVSRAGTTTSASNEDVSDKMSRSRPESRTERPQSSQSSLNPARRPTSSTGRRNDNVEHRRLRRSNSMPRKDSHYTNMSISSSYEPRPRNSSSGGSASQPTRNHKRSSSGSSLLNPHRPGSRPVSTSRPGSRQSAQTKVAASSRIPASTRGGHGRSSSSSSSSMNEDDARSLRSSSLRRVVATMNVVGADGQPIRSSMHNRGTQLSPRINESPTPIIQSEDEGLPKDNEDTVQVTTTPAPPPTPRSVSPSSVDRRAGFATRCGSLVRFSVYDEAFEIRKVAPPSADVPVEVVKAAAATVEELETSVATTPSHQQPQLQPQIQSEQQQHQSAIADSAEKSSILAIENKDGDADNDPLRLSTSISPPPPPPKSSTSPMPSSIHLRRRSLDGVSMRIESSLSSSSKLRGAPDAPPRTSTRRTSGGMGGRSASSLGVVRSAASTPTPVSGASAQPRGSAKKRSSAADTKKVVDGLFEPEEKRSWFGGNPFSLSSLVVGEKDKELTSKSTQSHTRPTISPPGNTASPPRALDKKFSFTSMFKHKSQSHSSASVSTAPSTSALNPLKSSSPVNSPHDGGGSGFLDSFSSLFKADEGDILSSTMNQSGFNLTAESLQASATNVRDIETPLNPHRHDSQLASSVPTSHASMVHPPANISSLLPDMTVTTKLASTSVAQWVQSQVVVVPLETTQSSGVAATDNSTRGSTEPQKSQSGPVIETDQGRSKRRSVPPFISPPVTPLQQLVTTKSSASTTTITSTTTVDVRRVVSTQPSTPQGKVYLPINASEGGSGIVKRAIGAIESISSSASAKTQRSSPEAVVPEAVQHSLSPSPPPAAATMSGAELNTASMESFTSGNRVTEMHDSDEDEDFKKARRLLKGKSKLMN